MPSTSARASTGRTSRRWRPSRASSQASATAVVCSEDQQHTTLRAGRPTPRQSIEVSLAPSVRARPVDEHVELLPHEQRHVVSFDAINDLEHARVDSLGAVARQRSFWQGEGLEAHELQRRLQAGVAADVADSGRALMHAPRLVFVNVDAHMERLRSTEQNQWIRRCSGWGEFTHSHLHLQNFCSQRRSNDAAFEVYLHRLHMGFCGGNLTSDLFEFCTRRFDRGPTTRDLFGADRAFVFYLLGEVQLSLKVRNAGLEHLRTSASDDDRLLPNSELRSELSCIQLKQRLPAPDILARRHEDSRHHPA